MTDTIPYYDTSTIDYKLLKAYYKNDTLNLKKLQEYAARVNTKLKWEQDLDSCIDEVKFEDIKSDEAYRFVYSSAFCPYTTLITIIRYGDSFSLRSIVYQYAWDSTPCKIVDKSSINIDSASWDKFQESLIVADFWGLKQDNGKHGLDGSTLEIYGFKKGTNIQWNPDKSTFISRWSPGYAAIFHCFSLLLKFSKTRKGCVTVS